MYKHLVVELMGAWYIHSTDVPALENLVRTWKVRKDGRHRDYGEGQRQVGERLRSRVLPLQKKQVLIRTDQMDLREGELVVEVTDALAGMAQVVVRK